MAVLTDPVVLVRDRLRAEWDATQTALASAPTIHTGWYDDSSTGPQVTVTNPGETAVGRGSASSTNYVATAGDGSGPVQRFDAFLLVNIWATRDDVDANPKQVVYDCKEQVASIMFANATGVEHLNRLALDNARLLVEHDETPTVYRFECEVGYSYRRRP